MGKENEQRLQQRYQHLEVQYRELRQKRTQARRRRWIVITLVIVLSTFLVLYAPKPLIKGLQEWDDYWYSDDVDAGETNNEEEENTAEKTADDDANTDNEAEGEEQELDDPSQEKNVFIVKEKALTDEIELTGQVNPIQWLEVSSPMTALVKKIHFSYGDFVKKGQLLLALDTVEQSIKVRQAESVKIEALKDYQRLKNWSQSSEVLSAQRGLNNARYALRFEEKNIKHTQTLYDKGVVSRNQLETEQQGIRRLKDSVIDAQEALKTTKEKASVDKLRMAELSVENAKQNLNALRKSLERANVYSPTSGIIFTQINKQDSENKEFVSELYEGSTVKKSRILFVVASLEGISIETETTEKQILKLKLGMPVTITLEALGESEFKGKITYIAERAEDSYNAREGAKFKIKVEARTLSTEQRALLRVGMTANLKLKTYHNPKAIVVPFDVLIPNGQGKMDENKLKVNVLKANGKYEQRTITVRKSLRDGVEVSDGLKAGEKLLRQE
jgi:multidrug efflux pump subunit AcrA (membrane-fusion protein)